jgi:hypothetical protein
MLWACAADSRQGILQSKHYQLIQHCHQDYNKMSKKQHLKIKTQCNTTLEQYFTLMIRQMSNIIKITRIKTLLLIFIGFFLTFYLLQYIYLKILFEIFNDVVKNLHPPQYRNLDPNRLVYLALYVSLSDFIGIIILVLVCLYIRIFKNKYFKESIFALLIFIAIYFILKFTFPQLLTVPR